MEHVAPSRFMKHPAHLRAGDKVLLYVEGDLKILEVDYAVKAKGPGWVVAFTDGNKATFVYNLFVTPDTPGGYEGDHEVL